MLRLKNPEQPIGTGRVPLVSLHLGVEAGVKLFVSLTYRRTSRAHSVCRNFCRRKLCTECRVAYRGSSFLQLASAIFSCLVDC